MNVKTLLVPAATLLLGFVAGILAAANWNVGGIDKTFLAPAATLVAGFLASAIAFINWSSTKEANELKINIDLAKERNNIFKEYHELLDSASKEDVTPETYFQKFWELQNRQIRLWLDGVIPDDEFKNYMDARFKEFAGIIKVPEFAYLKRNPKEKKKFEKYESYEGAWDAIRTQKINVYKNKPIDKLMDKVKEHKRSYTSFTLDEIKACRKEVTRKP